ncbi:MAG: hypothetical protein V4707_10245 [Pseudomonadota bacterium]
MTNENRDGAADIAWMRKLAEEGADAPMRGGSILMSAGLIYAAASVLHWAGITGLIGLKDEGLSALWLGATLMFFVVLILVTMRQKAEGGVRTAANKASGAAWAAVGWGIFATFASVAVVALKIGQDSLLLLALTPSIIMVFYGMGWAVSATMTKTKQLWWLAIGSFVAAPLLAALTGNDAQYLAYGGCLIVLMAIPGWLIMRRAQRG